MSNLQLNLNKVIRLQNVLNCKVSMEENVDINLIVEKMQSYIKVKGAMQIGP